MKLIEFQHYLKAQNLDVAVFVHPDITVTYFTQLKPSYALLFITPRKAVLYLTKLDALPKIPHITVKELRKSWEKEVRKLNAHRIAVNKETLSVSQLEKIKKIFPRCRIVDAAPALHQLRAQKTSSEINKIAKACQITTNAFNQLLQEFPRKSLHTEQDVALFLEKSFRQQGGDVAFPTIVAMGQNAAIPHHPTSNDKLGKGFLLLDFGASYQQYCADMTRVIYLGKPSPAEEQWYSLLLNAQQAAINTVAENLPFSALDSITRKHLGRYSSHFVHSLGHGIGVEVHESPSFFQDKKNIIKENHVFTIEPGIYFPGKFGLRIEDTLVYDGKVNILTKASKELIKIKW